MKNTKPKNIKKITSKNAKPRKPKRVSTVPYKYSRPSRPFKVNELTPEEKVMTVAVVILLIMWIIVN